MINNEILSFIKDQTAQGTTKDQIKDMLVGQGGWDEKDVEEAFDAVSFSSTSLPSAVKNASAVSMGASALSASPTGTPTITEEKSSGAFGTASELMKAMSGSNSARPSSPPVSVSPASSPSTPSPFAGGMSRVEQPKSMEPSASFAAELGSLGPKPKVQAAHPMEPAMAELASIGNTSFAGASSHGSLNDLRAGLTGGAPTMSDVKKEPSASVSQFSTPAASFATPAFSGMPTMQEAASPHPLSQGLGLASTPYQPPRVSSPVGNSAGMGMNMNTSPSFEPALQKSTFSPAPSLGGMGASAPAPASISPLSSLHSIQQPAPVVKTPGIMLGQNSALSMGGAPATRIKKQPGGRFLFGLIMLLIGLAIGAVFMNAYMRGFFDGEAMSGLVNKSLNMIGLGTPSVQEDVPASDGGT